MQSDPRALTIWPEKRTDQNVKLFFVFCGGSGAQSDALPADSVEFPPDWLLVIEAWQTLPEATKVGILAMVRAAGETAE